MLQIIVFYVLTWQVLLFRTLDIKKKNLTQLSILFHSVVKIEE